MSDIKATVEELDRNSRISTAKFLLVALREWPSLLAELRRLWAIEEAAVRYRDMVKRGAGSRDLLELMEKTDAAEAALFAAQGPKPCKARRTWCGEGDSNPHSPLGLTDFKSDPRFPALSRTRSASPVASGSAGDSARRNARCTVATTGPSVGGFVARVCGQGREL